MNHYFDDIFTRNSGRPKGDSRPKIRRSSTTRSIGARSDFDNSINGDHDDDDDDFDEDTRSRLNSVGPESDERERERREADAITATYVSEQLSRVRSHQSLIEDNGDEFEAQLDGQ